MYNLLIGAKMKEADNKLITKKMIERLIIIHNAIKSGMYPNNKQLQKLYCEQTGYAKVGEATISRDIDTLRTYFRAPLEYDRARNGFYYIDDKWEFALNQISVDDAFYLSSAKTLLANFKGTPMYDQIAKVIDFLTETQGHGKSQLLDRIAVPPLPKVSVRQEVWKPIMNALRDNTLLKFDYNGRWNVSTTHRLVRPYQLLFEDGMYCLFGYDELADKGKGGERLFCLPRMKRLENTDKTFELPKNFDFASRCGGGRFGAFKDEKKVRYEIDFYDDARQYIKDCVWADDQKFIDSEEENMTTIKFSSSQSDKVLEWVLAQGANARPIAPADFVERWKTEIRGMMRNAGISK